jgi:hypothetical protein
VHDTKSGVVVEPSKKKKIGDAIFSFYKDYKNGLTGVKWQIKPVLEKYERKRQAKQLARILDQLL